MFLPEMGDLVSAELIPSSRFLFAIVVPGKRK
jgi:hypothetical protein